MSDRRPSRAWSAFVASFAFAFLVSACASNRPAYHNDARGHLLIVGGGGTSSEMFERALAAAGGVDARVVVLPQASESAETGANSAKAWRDAGARNVAVLDKLDSVRSAAELRAASVIWFTGGVQTRLMKALNEAQLVELVRERYRDGAVVGGTSAGAAVMSATMITGDYDLGGGAKASAKAAQASASSNAAAQQGAAGAAPRANAEEEDSGLRYIRAGTNVFAEGLGLLPGAIVDQHFVQRQRFNRLLSALIDHPECVGIGIDEKTAILVHGTSFEVIGSSNVVVVDPRHATDRQAVPATPGAIRDVDVHVLRAGMSLDLAR